MRLAIANIIEFPMTITVPGSDGSREHSFRLTGKRYSRDEWNEALASLNAAGGDRDTVFLTESLTGWSGQDLVVNEEGAPEPFSAEALQLLLTVPGMSIAVFLAYQRAQHASLTEAGRLKNSAG